MEDYKQLIELLKLKGFSKIGMLYYELGKKQVRVSHEGDLCITITHIDTDEWRKQEINELYGFVNSKVYIENFL